MKHLRTMLTVAVFALGVLACGGPQGPHVRVATATAAELGAVEEQDVVWYDFEPGDVVPVRFLFLGAVEGGSQQPAVMRAKRRFHVVKVKNQPMQISFDGKTFAGPQSTKMVLAVMARDGGEGGELGWVLYIGEDGNVDAALSAASKQGKGGDSPSK